MLIDLIKKHFYKSEIKDKSNNRKVAVVKDI